MRLVDADVADKWMRQNNAFIDAAILKAIPTIDAVPVVRCRDCVHWSRSEEVMPDGKKADYGWCQELLDADSDTEIITSENDFCSFGERSTDNSTV